ncbi:hypothetical protein D3C81_654280 [compost metagenome]
MVERTSLMLAVPANASRSPPKLMAAPSLMLAMVVLATWLTSTEPAIATPLFCVDAPPLAAAATMREASAARTRTSFTPLMLPPLMPARVSSFISA